jgi:cytoskeleton protein RodZ
MTSEAGGESARGIGARLRAAREGRGLTLLQAAERLHVDARVLEALEAQDFAALGADVYVRGHLRRYAEAVGESAGELQELYTGSAPPAPPDLTRIPRGDSANRASPLVLAALLLVGGFALAGVLWWFLTLPNEKAQPLAGATPAPAAGDSAAAAGNPGTAAARGGSAAPAAAGAGGAPSASGAAQAQLDVRFLALSWVEISDADGRRLLHGLYAPGSAREVRGTAPLRVVLGNAPAVDLQLNGRPVAIAGLVHRNGSAYLLIDGSGHASAAAPRLAHGD